MKKIILLTGIILTMLLCGCGKDNTSSEDNQNATEPSAVAIPSEVAGVINEGEHEKETVLTTNTELVSAVQKINEKAVVEETEEPGLKMLSISLPIASKNIAKDFVSQVTNIVQNCDLQNAGDYSYYYFCVKNDDEILMVATFNDVEGAIKLAEVKAIDSQYSSELEKAVKGSDLFNSNN